MTDFRKPLIAALALCGLVPLLTATALSAQVPFACTGKAFLVQNKNAQLSQINQAVIPFTFTPIGGPAGIEYNNLGFRRADGLLYAAQVDFTTFNTLQIIQVDSTGTVFPLGLPTGLPTNVPFAAGDVSYDGTKMYLHTQTGTTLYILDLATFTATSVAVTGGTGQVLDWAYNPLNGLLYGGDRTHGELAILNPTNGVRTDVSVGGGGLPTGIAYGGSWFNAAGQLFVYRNGGRIRKIDLSGPTVVAIQTGPGSVRNDASACIQDVIGAAKAMTVTSTPPPGLPATIQIIYTFENFGSSPTDNLSNMAASDDLDAVFGAGNYGVTSRSSSPSAGFVNGLFDGSSNQALIAGAQSLAAGTTETVTITLTLTSLANAGMSGGAADEFCNSITVTGEPGLGIVLGDESTDGTDPDPDSDGAPVERLASCFSTADVPVELMSFSVD